MGDMTLFSYTIKIRQRGKDVSRGLLKRLIQLLIEGQLKDMHVDAVSDFRHTLISRQSLNDDLSFKVTYRAEEKTEPEDDAPEYQATLERSGTLDMSELVDYSTSTSAGLPLSQSQELLQALNIIVGHKSRTDPNTVTFGRNSRVSKAAGQLRLSLGGGLEALRAFVFSARAVTERVLINIQVKNLPFLVATPLTELVTAFRDSGGARPHPRSFLAPGLCRSDAPTASLQERRPCTPLQNYFSTCSDYRWEKSIAPSTSAEGRGRCKRGRILAGIIQTRSSRKREGQKEVSNKRRSLYQRIRLLPH